MSRHQNHDDNKAITELSTKKEESAEVVMRLIELGAVVVGKKSNGPNRY